jgi:hypothetical protein
MTTSQDNGAGGAGEADGALGPPGRRRHAPPTPPAPTRLAPTDPRWVDSRIRLLRAGTLTQTQEHQLATLGITAGTLTSAERRVLTELDRWIHTHGTAYVPQSATSRLPDGRSFRLGQRVRDLRQAHRHGRLPETIVRELEARAGWSWDGRLARHDATRERIAGTVYRTGRLPDPGTAGYQWLALQRRRAAGHQLTGLQLAQLKQIPGGLDRRVDTIRTFIQAAHAWLADGAPDRTMADLRYSTLIDQTGGAPYPLGRRAAYLRRRRAGLDGTHPMSYADAALLEALPGWTW